MCSTIVRPELTWVEPNVATIWHAISPAHMEHDIIEA